MSIEEEVRQMLRSRFPRIPFEFGEGGDFIARLRAPYPQLGALEICEDEGEVTFDLGDVAHGHFYASKKSQDRDHKIAEDLGDFLEKLFSDRVAMRKGSIGSSWWYTDGEVPKMRRSGAYYLWSRPLRLPAS